MCNIWKLFKTDAEGGGHQGWATLCGRLGQALRSDAYAGFREGQPTLVNYSRS